MSLAKHIGLSLGQFKKYWGRGGDGAEGMFLLCCTLLVPSLKKHCSNIPIVILLSCIIQKRDYLQTEKKVIPFRENAILLYFKSLKL